MQKKTLVINGTSLADSKLGKVLMEYEGGQIEFPEGLHCISEENICMLLADSNAYHRLRVQIPVMMGCVGILGVLVMFVIGNIIESQSAVMSATGGAIGGFLLGVFNRCNVENVK